MASCFQAPRLSFSNSCGFELLLSQRSLSASVCTSLQEGLINHSKNGSLLLNACLLGARHCLALFTFVILVKMPGMRHLPDEETEQSCEVTFPSNKPRDGRVSFHQTTLKAYRAQSSLFPVGPQMPGAPGPVGRPWPPAYSFYQGVTWSSSKPSPGCGRLLCGQAAKCRVSRICQ